MRSQSSIGIIGEADAESVPEMDIRHEIRMGAKVELLGEYFHPQHLGDTAWRIRAYRVDGQMVAGTNGDSVWQEQVPDDFAALLADYGAPSKWPKAVKAPELQPAAFRRLRAKRDTINSFGKMGMVWYLEIYVGVIENGLVRGLRLLSEQPVDRKEMDSLIAAGVQRAFEARIINGRSSAIKACSLEEAGLTEHDLARAASAFEPETDFFRRDQIAYAHACGYAD